MDYKAVNQKKKKLAFAKLQQYKYQVLMKPKKIWIDP
jgi:hypothetical protein